MLKNFRVEELVSSHLYQLLGENAWKLFDKEFLLDVDQYVSDLKRDLGVESVTINNWLWNGGFTQSGFRELSSEVGAAKSAHKSGMALDLKFKGCSVEDACKHLLINQAKYSKIRRIESIDFTPTWLHVDCKETGKDQIHIFNP